MKIIIYILTPIGAYIIDLLLGVITPFITLPITEIMVRLQNNPVWYRFRPDMVLQGMVRGFFVVYLTSFILSQIDVLISPYLLVLTIVLLSVMSVLVWDRTNPIAFEFSLNVSPIFGYFIGLLVL